MALRKEGKGEEVERGRGGAAGGRTLCLARGRQRGSPGYALLLGDALLELLLPREKGALLLGELLLRAEGGRRGKG
jgi:hypothetical protein